METRVLINIPNPFDKHSNLLYMAKSGRSDALHCEQSYCIVIGRGIGGGIVINCSLFPGRWL